MSETLKLTTELVNKKTPTPDDNGCQKLIADRLSKIGFTPKHLRFEDVDNLWITHGSSGPLFVFAGHTDTVPVGPIEKWNTDPYKAEIKEGKLYGRGAADMKSGIAAMEDPTNKVYVSSISITEIAIKASLGKLELSFDPIDAAERSGFEMLDFSAKDALLLKDLPFHHRDPFDRMLITQAISRKLIFVTQDSLMDPYDCRTLR